MIIIDVNKFGSVEKALKAYKKKYQKYRVLDELKSRKEFKKASVVNRDVQNKAKYREAKRPKED